MNGNMQDINIVNDTKGIDDINANFDKSSTAWMDNFKDENEKFLNDLNQNNTSIENMIPIDKNNVKSNKPTRKSTCTVLPCIEESVATKIDCDLDNFLKNFEDKFTTDQSPTINADVDGVFDDDEFVDGAFAAPYLGKL